MALRRNSFYAEFGEAVRAAGLPGEPFLDLGDTCALFAGDGSPLTQASGTFGEEELLALTRFYRDRAASWEAVLTPFSGIEAMTRLTSPDWEAKPIGWESTLYRPLAEPLPDEPVSPEIEVRAIEGSERVAWAELTQKAFFGDEPNKIASLLTRLTTGASCIRAYMAFWNGIPASAASLTVGRGVAVLGGGGTAPEFRGKGLQTALLRRRLQDAAAEADIATIGALPGSSSHRNAERLGFRIAWLQLSLRVPA
ncbi:MAG TPA: hypothetical protein VHE55_13470 [Fimbriimonadaceae bacterium]|nr:hypothetical protein [Fimbriimonadaceae bacterium]